MKTKKRVYLPFLAGLLGILFIFFCVLMTIECISILTEGEAAFPSAHSTEFYIILLFFTGLSCLFLLWGVNFLGCLIWVEDGILHRRGLLFGLRRSCPVQNILRLRRVSLGRKTPTLIYIIDKNPGTYGENAFKKSYICLIDTPANRDFIFSFCDKKIRDKK